MKDIKILIVEDEPAISRGLQDLFQFHDYQVAEAADGQTGLDMALTDEYDLILLDVMLPNLDGFSVCNEIRKHNREQPIIMLTAKTEENDIITGLTLGADDYVAKPFSVQQLLLRVEAVLRRSKKIESREAELNLGDDFTVDTNNLTGSIQNHGSFDLTRREIDILCFLKQNDHRPVSRAELLHHIWGYHKDSKIETRTVDIHMAKLRRKIEKNAKDPKRLVTIRGEGYKLVLGNKSN